MNGYYSVFDPDDKKIADCGALRDAVNLVGMRGEGHYYQFKPVYQTIDLEPFPQNQLPTKDIVVNMDGGVGGSWKEVEYVDVGGQKIATQQNLPQNCQEPFIPEFHD
jgi:hypothetical protein|tara:strand:- start:1255 stop:1575 length:321 start_codon:yes stop_codon:yes gene_type:complete